uniref:Putative ovule protein n=1 Tax=Solanum chacoense TaxID=4108 RepID=A0A0V0GIS4_SOLCH
MTTSYSPIVISLSPVVPSVTSPTHSPAAIALTTVASRISNSDVLTTNTPSLLTNHLLTVFFLLISHQRP